MKDVIYRVSIDDQEFELVSDLNETGLLLLPGMRADGRLKVTRFVQDRELTEKEIADMLLQGGKDGG